MVDAKAAASPGPNLGVIPDNYQLTYWGGPQIIHVDTTVTRTGKPSIRLDQHTASDVNTMRECDGKWYTVEPGDRIVAKCWIKTSQSGNPSALNQYSGGRIGIDFYAHTSAGYGVVNMWGTQGWPDSHPGDADYQLGTLPWGNDWTQKGYDVTIPTRSYTNCWVGGKGVVSCNAVRIDSFVVWLDVRPVADAGHVWFCDGEIYINPNFTSTAPPRAAPQNVQIAVSRVTASSYSDGHPPSLAVDRIESPYNYWGTNAAFAWLKLDLGSVYSINTVTTHFYDGSVRTYTYYIEVSKDSSSWTRVVPTRTGSGSVTNTFSQVGARFVRITIAANTAIRIEEIKVYGFS
jgi:hypothetical protein